MLILGLGLSWVSTEKSLWVCTNRSESLFLILRWENWTYQERMNNFPVTGKRILRFWELWDSENDQFETSSLRQDLCFFPCYLTKTKLYSCHMLTSDWNCVLLSGTGRPGASAASWALNQNSGNTGTQSTSLFHSTP
jgi:hypothetical protein